MGTLNFGCIWDAGLGGEGGGPGAMSQERSIMLNLDRI